MHLKNLVAAQNNFNTNDENPVMHLCNSYPEQDDSGM
jgi:hypothetical protein